MLAKSAELAGSGSLLNTPTLLGGAIHEGRTRCRAALEEIGAKRGLPPRTPPPGRDEDSATGPLVVVRPRIPGCCASA